MPEVIVHNFALHGYSKLVIFLYEFNKSREIYCFRSEAEENALRKIVVLDLVVKDKNTKNPELLNLHKYLALPLLEYTHNAPFSCAEPWKT